jgi:NADH-quinone oxidoreductase subunit I
MAMNPRASLELVADNCTSCMLCVRACPVWCLELDAHLEGDESSGRRRSILALDRFSIDYRTCMMCGLCVDICPFDALLWSSEPPPARFEWQR